MSKSQRSNPAMRKSNKPPEDATVSPQLVKTLGIAVLIIGGIIAAVMLSGGSGSAPTDVVQNAADNPFGNAPVGAAGSGAASNGQPGSASPRASRPASAAESGDGTSSGAASPPPLNYTRRKSSRRRKSDAENSQGATDNSNASAGENGSDVAAAGGKSGKNSGGKPGSDSVNPAGANSDGGDPANMPAQSSVPKVSVIRATHYVDLPALPKSASSISEQSVLDDLKPGDKYELRLLGLAELTPELSWAHDKNDPQNVTVYYAPQAGTKPSGRPDVIVRFRIDQGKLLVRWPHYDPGAQRRLQEVPRDCLLDIRGEEDPEARLVALRPAVVIKAERIDRLLKSDKKISLGRALAGIGKKKVFLEPLELVLENQVYDSDPIAVATIENREEQAAAAKRANAKKQKEGGTFIGKEPAKKDPSDDSDAPASPRKKGAAADMAAADEAATEFEGSDGLRHFRQQDFPEIAEDLQLNYFFLEIFPHADHLTLRLDTQPSQRELLDRLLAAKNNSRMAAPVGPAVPRPVVGKAGAPVETAPGKIPGSAGAPAAAPLNEQDLTAKLAELKVKLAEIGSGTISGNFYRIVEGVRVDVVRMGELTGRGGGTVAGVAETEQ